MKKKILYSGTFLLLVMFMIVLRGCTTKKEIEYRTTMAQKGFLQIEITATGYIQPVSQVDVGTQVSGIVQHLYVDYNSQVEKGQLLAELDKSTLKERVDQSQASFDDAESNLVYAQQNYDRVKKMYDAKAATQVSYEDAVNKLTQAKNSVINSKSNLNQAKVNLSYADIYSPISGRILNREVEEGQTVAASFSTPTLFSIANDMTKMQVEADVDEADIGQVQVGQSATFTVDAYPGETFQGTVQQIRLQATVTSNVVTYVVIIEAPNPEEKLFPGMTANVTIVTQSSEGILVPAEALYYVPDMTIGVDYVLTGQCETGTQLLWIKTPEGIYSRSIVAGATDGVNAIINQGVQEGEEIVLSAKAVEVKKRAAAANPLAPRRPVGGAPAGGRPRI